MKWVSISMGSLLLAALLLPLAGCEGARSDKVVATGVVTVDGAPLAQGTIGFMPLDGAGPSAEALITQGSYRIEMTPGEKRVMIQGLKPGPVDSNGVTTNIPFLPAYHNSESELTVEVSPEGKNYFPFELGGR